jgi:hypothetical protein
MRRFVEGVDRQQSMLFPESLEDWIYEDNPVRVIDVLSTGLDLAASVWWRCSRGPTAGLRTVCRFC